MRRRLALLGTALGFMALVLSAVPAVSSDQNGAQDRIVRWDLVQFVSGVVLSGGENVSEDAGTGDLITFTGSGHAKPRAERAFGGGTFVHEQQATGTIVQGAYHVTDFISWRRIDEGSFEATGLTDGIGNSEGATSGVLRLRIRLVPEIAGAPGPGVNGVLIIFCRLPGATVGFAEGTRLKIPSLGLDFVQHEELAGFTLFHVIA